jgi:alpha-galactosidase
VSAGKNLKEESSMRSLVLMSSLALGLGMAAGCSSSNSKSAPTPSIDAATEGTLPPPEVDDDLPAAAVPGPSPTPPMGWNSWNAFASNISDPLFRQMADAMVTSGMAAVGYKYVTIDDTWSTKIVPRAADQALVPDVAKFPNGVAPIADYVHGKGLKLGIHADRGVLTCSYYPGSEGHEQQDADTFAGWGVDFVKYDNCPPAPVPTPEMLRGAYTAMGAALKSTNRSIVFSLCAWSFYEWGLSVGSLWRTTGDITPNRASVLANLMTNNTLAAYAGPNGWNDPDMLEVGNFVPSNEETEATLADYRAHFSLWAIAAAPLITGNDLRHMSDGVKNILTNKEVIDLDQDLLGYQGVPVRPGRDLSVWAKPLNESGARGVVLFNDSDSANDLTVKLTEIGLQAGSATARDLWAHADRGPFTDSFTANVAPHDVVVLRIKGQEPAHPPAGKVYLSDLPWIYAANGVGPVERDQSNGASMSGDGGPISIRGTTYAKGLGVAGPSAVVYRLAKACTTFSAMVGLDDQTKGLGSVAFQVWADGEKLFDSADVSAVVTGLAEAIPVQVDVTGKRRLKLLVTNGGNGSDWDYLSWADAHLDCQ